MKLLTFIESLLISIHWEKIFQFFSTYLLEIDQAWLKNPIRLPKSRLWNAVEMTIASSFLIKPGSENAVSQ